MMPKILITGAGSFIGTSFKKYSIFEDIEEVCLKEKKIEDIDFKDTDVIFHVAAIVHQKKSIPENIYFNINTELPIELAKKAKSSGVKQFVFMSTVKVYGEFKSGMQKWNEDTICNPEDNYGKSKYLAEKKLKELASPSFTISIIRTPLVYGKGVKANMTKIINLVKKVPVLPLKNTNNKRSFTYIENLVGFIDRIIELNISGVFIAKDKKDLSTTELVELIAKYLNKKVILIKMPKIIVFIGKKLVPGIFDRLYGSFEMENEKTLKKLAYNPLYSSEEGIKRMLQ